MAPVAPAKSRPCTWTSQCALVPAGTDVTRAIPATDGPGPASGSNAAASSRISLWPVRCQLGKVPVPCARRAVDVASASGPLAAGPVTGSTASTSASAATVSTRRLHVVHERSTMSPPTDSPSVAAADLQVCPASADDRATRGEPHVYPTTRAPNPTSRTHRATGAADGGTSPSTVLGSGDMDAPLTGKVALVAGATRGAGRGIAVELGAAGATVYCTGRTTRTERSEMDRPETIEETAELVDAAGGTGIAVQVDHLVPDQVAALVERIDAEQGALHVLVNDIFGATTMEWNATVWESDLDVGLRLLHLAVDTHAITSHFALPLLIETPGGLVVEVNDGTDEYNATNYRVSFFYDLAKAAVGRMAWSRWPTSSSRTAHRGRR